MNTVLLIFTYARYQLKTGAGGFILGALASMVGLFGKGEASGDSGSGFRLFGDFVGLRFLPLFPSFSHSVSLSLFLPFSLSLFLSFSLSLFLCLSLSFSLSFLCLSLSLFSLSFFSSLCLVPSLPPSLPPPHLLLLARAPSRARALSLPRVRAYSLSHSTNDSASAFCLFSNLVVLRYIPLSVLSLHVCLSISLCIPYSCFLSLSLSLSLSRSLSPPSSHPQHTLTYTHTHAILEH